MITPKSKKVVLAGLLSATLAGGSVAAALPTIVPAIAEDVTASFGTYDPNVALYNTEWSAALPYTTTATDPSTLQVTVVYNDGAGTNLGAFIGSVTSLTEINLHDNQTPAGAKKADVYIQPKNGGMNYAVAHLNLATQDAAPINEFVRFDTAALGGTELSVPSAGAFTTVNVPLTGAPTGYTFDADVYFADGNVESVEGSINGSTATINLPSVESVEIVVLNLRSNNANGDIDTATVTFTHDGNAEQPGDGNNGGSTEQPGDGNTDNGGSTEQPGDGNTDNGGETVVPGEEEKPAEGSELEPGTAAGEKDEAAKEEAKSEAKDGATILPNTSDPAVAGGVVAGLAAVVSGAAALIRRKK